MTSREKKMSFLLLSVAFVIFLQVVHGKEHDMMYIGPHFNGGVMRFDGKYFQTSIWHYVDINNEQLPQDLESELHAEITQRKYFFNYYTIKTPENLIPIFDNVIASDTRCFIINKAWSRLIDGDCMSRQKISGFHNWTERHEKNSLGCAFHQASWMPCIAQNDGETFICKSTLRSTHSSVNIKIMPDECIFNNMKQHWYNALDEENVITVVNVSKSLVINTVNLLNGRVRTPHVKLTVTLKRTKQASEVESEMNKRADTTGHDTLLLELIIDTVCLISSGLLKPGSRSRFFILGLLISFNSLSLTYNDSPPHMIVITTMTGIFFCWTILESLMLSLWKEVRQQMCFSSLPEWLMLILLLPTGSKDKNFFGLHAIFSLIDRFLMLAMSIASLIVFHIDFQLF